MGQADSGIGWGNKGHVKFIKGKKLGRVGKGNRCSVGIFILFFGLVGLTLLGGNYSGNTNGVDDGGDDEGGNHGVVEWKSGRKAGHLPIHGRAEWVSNVIGFGHSSTISGQDSRYWDKDDRRRDGDYIVDDTHISNMDTKPTVKEGSSKGKNPEVSGDAFSKSGKNESDHGSFRFDISKESGTSEDLEMDNKSLINLSQSHGGDLYHEKNRNELKIYEAQYEAGIRHEVESNENVNEDRINSRSVSDHDDSDMIDEYDDVIDNDSADMVNANSDSNRNTDEEEGQKTHGSRESQKSQNKWRDEKLSIGKPEGLAEKNESFQLGGPESINKKNLYDGEQLRRSGMKFDNNTSTELSLFTSVISQEAENVSSKQRANMPRAKRRRHPNVPCEIPFLNSTGGLVEPDDDSIFANFSLKFIEHEQKPDGVQEWNPRFAGHQSLREREDSFYARDQTLHCGFIKGPQEYLSTGFDLSQKDVEFLQKCHIAVSSCIFGNSDNIRTPTSKKISRKTKQNVCFVMFVDNKTLETLSVEGRRPDENGRIGLWRIVVIKNLPYTDMRRVGKVPKLLTHRLFPFARYSIWIDSKMRLDVDPVLILERFLWRDGFEYAISNHYDRHCVWEEVMQNKRLNKYNHTVIDEQFTFYQADGLTKFNGSDPEKVLPSYVPEGSFIVRAHTPMSNLFSCLWFNEVDRFTSRDQLSFAYTFLKLKRMNPDKNFRLNMFKDCERRYMAKLFHHRNEEVRSSRSKII